MNSEHFDESPLDSLLDQESEEEFGLPEIRNRYDHQADENSGGNLSEWSAQDFASIYVRFRPHLERHARRYLSNQMQAEEVVQDAFLYLMTSLPELDSELGVLKFLKWKIRLLALDVLRSSSAKREIAVPDHEDYTAESEELHAELERAEDSAVIQMALAKLNPRQREALVASVYQEKSSEDVAIQLGLSPNAARQLVFRAKNAFKRALVGEAETQGKSVGQILSIAAKKAAFEAKENAVKVGAFLVLAAAGVGILPGLILSDETVIASAPSSENVGPSILSDAPINSLGDESFSAVPPVEENLAEKLPAEVKPDSTAETQQGEAVIDTEFELASSETELDQDENSFLVPQNFTQVLSTNAGSAFFYTNSKPDIFQEFDGESIQIFAGTGVSAFLDYRPEELTIYNAILQVRVQDELLFAVPTEFKKSTLYDGTKFDLVFEGSNFYLVRVDGTVVSESVMWEAKSKAIVQLDTSGHVIDTSLVVSR